jgi:hypothetical protein
MQSQSKTNEKLGDICNNELVVDTDEYIVRSPADIFSATVLVGSGQ